MANIYFRLISKGKWLKHRKPVVESVYYSSYTWKILSFSFQILTQLRIHLKISQETLCLLNIEKCPRETFISRLVPQSKDVHRHQR